MNLITYIFGKVLHHNKTAQNESHTAEHEIREAVAQLQAMSDRELSELGVSRGDIEYAVRYGRFTDQQAA